MDVDNRVDTSIKYIKLLAERNIFIPNLLKILYDYNIKKGFGHLHIEVKEGNIAYTDNIVRERLDIIK